jgi:hypothetical protein
MAAKTKPKAARPVVREADRSDLRRGDMALLRAHIDAALKRRGLDREYDTYNNFFNHHKKTERINER